MNMLSSFTNALHPLFVHFPIVLWLAALLVTALSLGPDKQARWRVGIWLLHASSVAAVVAAASGWFASEQLGHDSPGHGLVHGHRDTMLVAVALGLLASVVALLKRKEPTKPLKMAVVALLAATALTMSIGADRGAELVYRYGVGVAREVPPEGAPHSHGDEGAGHGDEGAGHGDEGDHHDGASPDHHGAAPGDASSSAASASKATSSPDAPAPSVSSSAPAASAPKTKPPPTAPTKPKPAAPPAAPPAPEHEHAAGHEHTH